MIHLSYHRLYLTLYHCIETVPQGGFLPEAVSEACSLHEEGAGGVQGLQCQVKELTIDANVILFFSSFSSFISQNEFLDS